jgi:hypothetical protein
VGEELKAMLRQTAVLAMAFGAVICSGCGGDASSGPAVATAPNSAPPKPIPFKEDEAAAATKQSADAPTQLGGPQIRALLGASRATAASNAGSRDANSGATNQGGAPTDSGASKESTPASTQPADSAAQPPANDASPPASDPAAARNSGRGVRRHDGSPPPAQQTDPAATTDGQNAVKAEAGVGAQGKDYGDADGGYISEPVSMYFNARELIAFQQMTKGMRFFEADKQRKPKSHEEFMKEIIQAYGVSLPELPAGEKYQYDPKKGELMVLRPKK